MNLSTRLNKLESEHGDKHVELVAIPPGSNLKQAERIYSENLRRLRLAPKPKNHDSLSMSLDEARAIYEETTS